jgi:hypothetical protein
VAQHGSHPVAGCHGLKAVEEVTDSVPGIVISTSKGAVEQYIAEQEGGNE